MANEPEKPSNERAAPQAPQQARMRAGQETWRRWSDLVARVWADQKLKQRLMDNPAAVLGDHGIEVPTGVEIRVVENTDKVSYLILPAQSGGGIQLNY